MICKDVRTLDKAGFPMNNGDEQQLEWKGLLVIITGELVCSIPS
jgi:RNA polymerase subunit RPABC4/transcription elongation factor Spt4